MKSLGIYVICLAAWVSHALASTESSFTAAELELAKFWADMGPTLSNEGVESYARRYHENFSHWDIQNTGRISDKDSAIRYWGKFHDSGNRITCTHVEPVDISLFGEVASARLIYEQTDELADGTVRTGVWRMVALFQRNDENWQVLETNMVDFDTQKQAGKDESYLRHCPS